MYNEKMAATRSRGLLLQLLMQFGMEPDHSLVVNILYAKSLES